MDRIRTEIAYAGIFDKVLNFNMTRYNHGNNSFSAEISRHLQKRRRFVSLGNSRSLVLIKLYLNLTLVVSIYGNRAYVCRRVE